jgi:integrase
MGCLAGPRRRALRCTRQAGVRRETLHGARHTALTLMEKAGVPISLISLWAGHASAEFTYRVYVHANDTDLAAGRDTLGRIYKIADGA